MKIKASTGKKLKYGGTSVALTALIIAIIIVVNVIASLLVQRFTVYADLTPDLHFTISDECYELIGGKGEGNAPIEMLNKFREENKKYNAENGLTPDSEGYRDEHVMINILFGREYDTLLSGSESEYIVRNAEELKTKYPDHINLEFVDARRNPSRFTKYKSSNTEKLDSNTVIVECGSEFRPVPLSRFFLYSEGKAFAYNGEKAYASAILATTRAEVPLACYTVNHGESFPTSEDNGTPFINSLESAGFRIQPIDLSKDAIPEECRIMVVFDPKQDFLSGRDGISAESELDKLDAFLADRNALMVFMDPDSYTGRLTNLEDFLGEWGLAIRRDGNDPYKVRDAAASIMGDSSAVVSDYAKNELANGWTASMTSGASAPAVVIPNGTALTYANGYDRHVVSSKDDPSVTYPIGVSSTFQRTVYDLFTAGEGAKAYAGGREIASSTKADPLKLMAVSVQTYTEQEYLTAIEDSAYVLLCGSTDFASDKYLSSKSYGNADFMLSALQMAGREPVPVGLEYKEFAKFEIETVTAKAATQCTVILTLIPVVVSLFVGVFIMIRRKNR